jgi:hypothetical protein
MELNGSAFDDATVPFRSMHWMLLYRHRVHLRDLRDQRDLRRLLDDTVMSRFGTPSNLWAPGMPDAAGRVQAQRAMMPDQSLRNA